MIEREGSRRDGGDEREGRDGDSEGGQRQRGGNNEKE